MGEMENYCIYAKPEQYEDIMELLYNQQIFPFEEDPINLQDYINNFNFTEKCNGMLKFLLLCSAGSNMDSFEEDLKQLECYDPDVDLPRLELDDPQDARLESSSIEL